MEELLADRDVGDHGRSGEHAAAEMGQRRQCAPCCLAAAEIVDYLERTDPGRYWAASLLTTAVLATSGPGSPSEFRLFPTHEEFAKIGGNPFPEAARRFMRRTGIVLDLE